MNGLTEEKVMYYSVMKKLGKYGILFKIIICNKSAKEEALHEYTYFKNSAKPKKSTAYHTAGLDRRHGGVNKRDWVA